MSPQGAVNKTTFAFFVLGILAIYICVPKSARVHRRYVYDFPHPALGIDNVIVVKPQARDEAAKVLLVKRKYDPDKGLWALPGGFVKEWEGLEDAAARELWEETSVDAEDITFIQVGAFGDPGRDPRHWCVSVAFGALVPDTRLAKAGDDAAEAQWHSVLNVPELAFDHKLILRTAFRQLAKEEAAQQDGLSKQLIQGAEQLAGEWRHRFTPSTQRAS